MGGDDDSCGGGAVSLRFLVGVVVGEAMVLAAAAPSVDRRGEEEGSEEVALLKESPASRRRFRGRPRRFLGTSWPRGILDPES
jgi:hypothetical protein